MTAARALRGSDGDLPVGLSLPHMSGDRPEAPPVAALAAALHVRRNVVIGAVAGFALGAGAYLVRVFELFGPVAGTREYPVLGVAGWFLLLAFVLAVTSALLIATGLTVLSAILLARTGDHSADGGTHDSRFERR